MPIVINTNVASLQSQKNLSGAQAALVTSFNRLSSGYRINSAKDDAAGLAISEAMRLQIRSYMVAERNANDAISMAQTAEGSLAQITDLLGRMRELAVQGANGILTTSDRSYLQTEFGQLQAEVSRIQSSAKFNNKLLLNATVSVYTFQVGIYNTVADRIQVSFGGVSLATLQSLAVSGGTGTLAQNAIDTIDASLTTIVTARARLGSVMNRFDVVIANTATVRVNLAAANSRIRDVDIAEETAQLARQQVLMQAGSSILAQANQAPQMALSLLRG